MRHIHRVAVLGVIALFAAAVASPARAAAFGVRTGVYADANAGFVGGEVLTSIAPNFYFDPNLEVALANNHDVVTVNGDFHYDFLTDRSYYVWAGGGPGFIHREREFEPDRNDLGLNLLAGIGWKASAKVTPYVQATLLVSSDDEAVLAFGMRF